MRVIPAYAFFTLYSNWSLCFVIFCLTYSWENSYSFISLFWSFQSLTSGLSRTLQAGMIYTCAFINLYRKLVGLRWWNLSKEDGTEEWIFESVDISNNIIFQLIWLETENAADNRIFWVTNYAAPVLWIILLIVNVLTFSLSNAVVCLFAFGLTITNLAAFLKCDKN